MTFMRDFDTSVRIPVTEGREIRAHNRTEAKATYWWTEADGVRQRHWNRGRSRGLEKADSRLGGALSDTLDSLLARDGRLTVLEVGCGYGRVLLELRAGCGDRLDLHGINVEPGYNETLIRAFAQDQDLDVPGVPFPAIHIHDVDQGIPFPDATFDLVLSVATFHSIRDKLRFLEQVSRILKPDGTALIEFPTARVDMNGEPMPLQYQQRIEIWQRGQPVDVCSWLGSAPGVTVGEAAEDRYFMITKALSSPLQADLVTSFFLSDLCESWWGCQSIYRCGSE
jgi:SAM-dependent methyltransferase